MGDGRWARVMGDGRGRWVLSRLLLVELLSFSAVGLRSLLESYALLGMVSGPTPTRAYREAIELNRRLAKVAGGIERSDQELLRQLKRAAGSVALMLAEGIDTAPVERALRLQTALAAMREVEACLDIAAAWGYLPKGDRDARKSADRVTDMVKKLMRLRQAPLIARR